MNSVSSKTMVVQATSSSLTSARERLLAWILANEAKRRMVSAASKMTALVGNR